jgi:beta-phosphoglucomutase-like phosphatase (HAD superfamily)
LLEHIAQARSAAALRSELKAPTGVRAGVAAGMTVFGYCALTPRQRLIEAGAHHTFEHMRDLPDLIGRHA